jgi:chromosomal replication initiation ATPase DnaA
MPEPHPPEPEPDAPELPPASFQYTMSAARRIAQAALVPHGMTWTDAMGPSRKLPYTNARKDVYAALRAHGWSLKKIAIFCGRDHTTIMNALHPKKERNK